MFHIYVVVTVLNLFIPLLPPYPRCEEGLVRSCPLVGKEENMAAENPLDIGQVRHPGRCQAALHASAQTAAPPAAQHEAYEGQGELLRPGLQGGVGHLQDVQWVKPASRLLFFFKTSDCWTCLRMYLRNTPCWTENFLWLWYFWKYSMLSFHNHALPLALFLFSNVLCLSNTLSSLHATVWSHVLELRSVPTSD